MMLWPMFVGTACGIVFGYTLHSWLSVFGAICVLIFFAALSIAWEGRIK
jgi:hypothetical protein